jgi:hypothetical protein
MDSEIKQMRQQKLTTVMLGRILIKLVHVRFARAPWKGGAFQWVQIPPGKSLQPEATGAVMEVTKWLKPTDSVSRYTVTARVCRP